MGQLTITDEEEQNQNQTDRHADYSQKRSDDGSNPWSKQQDEAQSQSTTTTEVVAKPVSNSNVYVPPSMLRGEVNMIF